MIEIKTEEPEAAPENTSTTTEEEKTEEAEIAPPLPLPPPPTPPPPPTQEENKEEQPQQPTQNNNDGKEETTLNPLNNEPDNQSETESKGKNRRYWTPKEEDRFFQIWGRENWRLTKHGKNTVFFAKWAEEMKEKCGIDVKPEEVQCKVNQTRAKFRQVKRLLDTDRNAIKWKKFDLVEKILKNQYRSKDDEPVPQEALENNRDMSPTELLNNSGNRNLTSPTNSMSNAEQGINLNQITVDFQLAEDISLSDHNLTSNVFSNNSQSSTSFSTELFGIDQMEIKQEIETDLKRDGFSEFIPIGPNEQANAEGQAAGAIVGQMDGLGQIAPQQHEITPNSTLPISQVPSEISNNNNINQNAVPISNNRTFPFAQNHTALVAASNNNSAEVLPNHTSTNHTTAMEPPRRPSVTATTTPRKRNRTTSAAAQAAAAASTAPASQDALESMYLEEIKKKNVILVEQGEINRKRLRLEERKVKLMEEFFPKYLTLQQDILKKLDNITNSTPEAINIRIEE